MRAGKDGERYGNNQLLALRTQDAKAFMLGIVSWRSVTLSGQLRIGVQYFPGVAQAVTLNANIKDADFESLKSVSALLLPAIATLKIPASLIIPRDVFKPNRISEMLQQDQVKSNIKMELSVLGGVDFERISFTQKQ